MKFSIRGLLALVVICALGMLVWRSSVETSRQQLLTDATFVELEKVRAKLHVDQPDAYNANLRVLDEYALIREMRVKGEQHFQTIQDKYSGIIPRGDGVLSIRAMPTLCDDVIETPIKFRIHVPNKPVLWLKYGVHPTKRNTQSSRAADTLDDLVEKSPFEHSGPYELQLQPGDQTIDVDLMHVAGNKLPFRLKLSDQTLVNSAFHSDEVDGYGRMSVSASEQFDADLKRRLPTLMTVNMGLVNESKARMSWGFSIWFSDHSSDFQEFPELD